MMSQMRQRAYIYNPRREARKCDAPGCNETTRENKPYCSGHVTLHPYIQAILNRNAEDDALVTDDVG